jgi:hypothetical protein
VKNTIYRPKPPDYTNYKTFGFVAGFFSPAGMLLPDIFLSAAQK